MKHIRINFLRVDQLKWSKSLVALVSLLIFSNTAFGQIESMYSMYRFNPQIITPAHAGSTETSEATLMSRQQWLGIEGAPKTLVFSGNFKFKQQSGLGVNAMLDQAGPLKITTISGDYAYHTKLSGDWTFSGGIRAGLANLNLDFTGLALSQTDDALFATNRSSGLKFNTGWGLRVQKNDGFFISVSQPRLLKYNLGSGYKDVAYFYTMVGTKIKASDKIALYPSVMFRSAVDVPISWDANVMANLSGKIDIGLNYRHQDSWGIRAGIQATKSIYLGYVFEMPTSQLSRVSVQSHEIALRYSFGK
jgi:type IX secretion system PorP/SprF family membrane protein